MGKNSGWGAVRLGIIERFSDMLCTYGLQLKSARKDGEIRRFALITFNDEEVQELYMPPADALRTSSVAFAGLRAQATAALRAAGGPGLSPLGNPTDNAQKIILKLSRAARLLHQFFSGLFSALIPALAGFLGAVNQLAADSPRFLGRIFEKIPGGVGRSGHAFLGLVHG